MAVKQLSDLVNAGAVGDEDLLLMRQGGEDKKVRAAELAFSLDKYTDYEKLGDGFWSAGKVFTTYTQYLIYNGEAYRPLPETTFPYVVSSVPDLGFVYQIKLNSHPALSGLNAVGGHDSIYSRVFGSVTSMKAVSSVISDFIDTNDLIVKTKGYYGGWAVALDPQGAAEYTLTTLARVRVVKSNPSWVPDGYGDHYLAIGDGQTYVAMLLLDDKADVLKFGAPLFAGGDSLNHIQAAIDNDSNLPAYAPRGRYYISDTLVVGPKSRSLEGSAPMMRSDTFAASTVIEWIGGVEPRKTMIQLGQNAVGAEPALDSTANQLRNMWLLGDNKVGFLVYGTYVTNDSWVSGVGGQDSTEYNFYFARCWYASFENITSKNCKNNGVAFGMPLIYSDNTGPTWTTPAPLEMNQCFTNNIRSHSSGRRFSVDNPGTYNPLDATKRMHGYGIGAGIGNAFRLENFTSEASGGVNLYYYSETQPSKYVGKGYLENSCVNSGLNPASTLPNVIIDVSVGNSAGGGETLEDVFMNFESGGIYTYRNGNTTRKPIQLNNIYQPRFLKDIGGETDVDQINHPYQFIVRKAVYFGIGLFNLLGGHNVFQNEAINIRYSWGFDVPCGDSLDSYRILIRNKSATWNPSGSISLTRGNGSIVAIPWPASAPQNEWVTLRFEDGALRLDRAGGAGTIDQNVDFKIVSLPATQV